ncbi:SRPBCC family protein [Bacillaceae bacterium C204]|uniref:SRPBCC family protein n=1 Tax=Neobacillus sp. 204 TaxID=3383351 RepID=UPI003979DE5A
MNHEIYVGEKETVITQIFDAPRELVYQAWTQPENLAQWWGPKGFTNTFKEFDLRPGGTWEFIMHSPDGADFPNKSVFVEIVKPNRVVLNHVSGPHFQITATFEEHAGKTKFTFRQSFETEREFAKVKSFAIDGNKETIDRLEAHLEVMSR